MEVLFCGIPNGRTQKVQHQAAHRLLNWQLYQRGCTDFTMEYGRLGKPSLQAYPQLHFNLSHATGICVSAVGSFPMGVDVEPIRPLRPKVIRRICTAIDCPGIQSGRGVFPHLDAEGELCKSHWDWGFLSNADNCPAFGGGCHFQQFAGISFCTVRAAKSVCPGALHHSAAGRTHSSACDELRTDSDSCRNGNSASCTVTGCAVCNLWLRRRSVPMCLDGALSQSAFIVVFPFFIVNVVADGATYNVCNGNDYHNDGT